MRTNGIALGNSTQCSVVTCGKGIQTRGIYVNIQLICLVIQ